MYLATGAFGGITRIFTAPFIQFIKYRYRYPESSFLHKFCITTGKLLWYLTVILQLWQMNVFIIFIKSFPIILPTKLLLYR